MIAVSNEPQIFFPQERVDEWVVAGTIEIVPGDRVPGTLTIVSEARTYSVEEAVFIKAEVTTGVCPYDLLGKVQTRHELLAKQAELMEDSMVLGDHAYDVIAGWVGRPTSHFNDHLQTAVGDAPAAQSEEELLLRALGR